MTSLQRLSLEGNRLTSLPKELGDLGALRVLNANGNLLTAIPGGQHYTMFQGLAVHHSEQYTVKLLCAERQWQTADCHPRWAASAEWSRVELCLRLGGRLQAVLACSAVQLMQC